MPHETIKFVRRDTVRGYLLEVAEWWENYSADERALMTNGIGIDAMPVYLRTLLETISGFLPAADVHDFDWEVLGRGFRNKRFGRPEYRRLIKLADRRFYRNCKAVVRQDGDTLFRHPFRFIRRRKLARAFYRAVRLGAVVKTAERR